MEDWSPTAAVGTFLPNYESIYIYIYISVAGTNLEVLGLYDITG